MSDRTDGPRRLTSIEWLVRLLFVAIGLAASTALLESVDIVLYPDAFPGYVYVDEEGHRYVYARTTLKP